MPRRRLAVPALDFSFRAAATAFLTLSALSSTTAFVSAQTLTVRQVLVDCPDLLEAKACVPLAEQFLVDRAPRGPTRDGQIVNLVIAIAEAARYPKIPMLPCLNAADGLRVLAEGVSNAGEAAQIREIADTLCVDTQT